jgi:hypothetical protein
MKLRPALRAFTLVELSVSTAVFSLAFGILFTGLQTIALLGAKNSAINLTHQQSRAVIHQAVFQIHESVSVPALATAALGSVAGNGPAAGVTYQAMAGGPYRVWSSVANGATSIQIDTHPGDPAPQAGQRLIIPAFEIEQDITAVASAGGSPPLYNLTLAGPVTGTSITCSAGTPNYVAYLTQRSALAVVAGELRYYPRSGTPATYSTIARGLTTPTPFSVPGGDNRFIQASFAAQDPKIAGLNLKSVANQMQITVPYRYRLTTQQ